MNVASYLVLTVALAFSTALAAFNANISEGQCYYAPGKLLDPRFIPCGNANGGPLPCCQGLDNCLSSLACYDASAGTTYLAGCTDETYSDILCPNKAPFDDNPWSGLVWCTSDSSIWVACDDEGPTVTKGAPCSCSEAPANPAFTDAETLTNIMSLPYSTGGPISWWVYYNDIVNGQTLSGTFGAGYYSVLAHRNTAPSLSQQSGVATVTSTATTSMSTTVTSTYGIPSSGTGSSNSPTAVSSSSASSSNIAVTLPSTTPQSSTGGHGKLIGFVVGFAGGTALLLAIGYFCWRQRLKKNRAIKEGSASENSGQAEDIVGHHLNSVSDPLMNDANARSPAWSGHKSELPADSEGGTGTGLVHNQHRSFAASIVSPATTSSQWGSTGGRFSNSDFGSQRMANGTGAPHRASPTSANTPQRTSELAGEGVYEMP